MINIQGPLVAFAVHHHGETGIFILITVFVLTPIVALARTLKLDDSVRLPVAKAQTNVLKEM